VTGPASPQRVMADELPGDGQQRWEAAGRQLAALAEHGYAVVSVVEPQEGDGDA
jgi:hypothetical protein